MNAERQAKVNQVKEIASQIATSKALVIAEYAGLKVKEIQEIKEALSSNGIDIKVYKNRLFKIASKEANLNFDKYLTGPNIYAFGKDDEIAPAKMLSNFAKTYEALKLKSGLYEGKIIGSKELAEIASLPTLDEARGILAMSLIGPLRYLAIGLDMLTKNEKLLKSDTKSKSQSSQQSEAKQEEDNQTQEVSSDSPSTNKVSEKQKQEINIKEK